MADRNSGVGGDNRGGFFEELIGALANKHSQIELNFDRTGVRFTGTPVAVEVSGTITFSVHMRDMTDAERQAYAQKNVAAISATQGK